MIKVNPILEKMKTFADDLDDCEVELYGFDEEADYEDCLIVKVYLREVEHD